MLVASKKVFKEQIKNGESIPKSKIERADSLITEVRNFNNSKGVDDSKYKAKVMKQLKFGSKVAYKKDKKRKDSAQALKFLRKLGRKLRSIHKVRHKSLRKASSDVLSCEEEVISPRMALMKSQYSKNNKLDNSVFQFQVHQA